MSVQMYSFTIFCPRGDYELGNAIVNSPDLLAIRVNRLITSVSNPGLGSITGLYIANHNQLLIPTDPWRFSARLAQQIREAFLTEHGLLGKSYQEIDTYLDEHELSLPNPNRVELPTISPSAPIKITGHFDEGFTLSFLGLARIDERS